MLIDLLLKPEWVIDFLAHYHCLTGTWSNSSNQRLSLINENVDVSFTCFLFEGKPPTAATNNGHGLPDRNLPLLPGRHAPHHSPTWPPEFRCPASRTACQIPDFPPAVRQCSCRSRRSGQNAAAEREPPPVAGVWLRRQAARAPAAVRQRQHGPGPAPPAELRQGKPESTGNHRSEHSTVTTAAAAVSAAAAAPSQTHHEQTGNICMLEMCFPLYSSLWDFRCLCTNISVSVSVVLCVSIFRGCILWRTRSTWPRKIASFLDRCRSWSPWDVLFS